MKRAIIATLILASSILVGTAVPADAAIRCDRKSWTKYLGVDGPGNLRYAEFNLSMRACWNANDGSIVRRETDMSATIDPNLTSKATGTEWNIDANWTRIPYGEYQIPYNNYSDRGYFNGFFRICTTVRGVKVCSPYNADFAAIMTFNAPAISDGAGGIDRWDLRLKTGKYGDNPGAYDNNVAFYNTP